MPEIAITPSQQIAVSKIVRDNFGSYFQTGLYAGSEEWVYLTVSRFSSGPSEFYFIRKDGHTIKGIEDLIGEEDA